MLDGYWRALFLLDRIVKSGLTPELRREVEGLLAADEKHMLRDGGD